MYNITEADWDWVTLPTSNSYSGAKISNPEPSKAQLSDVLSDPIKSYAQIKLKHDLALKNSGIYNMQNMSMYLDTRGRLIIAYLTTDCCFKHYSAHVVCQSWNKTFLRFFYRFHRSLSKTISKNMSIIPVAFTMANMTTECYQVPHE